MKVNQLGRGIDHDGWLVRADWHEEHGEDAEAARWRLAPEALAALCHLAGCSQGDRGVVRIGGAVLRYSVARQIVSLAGLSGAVRWHIPRSSLALARPAYLRGKALEIAAHVLSGDEKPTGRRYEVAVA